MHSELSGKAAIVGIGQTEFSKKSGRSELRLAVEAVKAAIADAGLEPSDIEGLTTFSLDTNPEIDVARAMGIPELKFMSRIHYGGGAACAVVHQAAMAVLTGTAKYVVVYRAFNERSGRRFGAGQRNQPTAADAEQVAMSWLLPFGLVTPASWVAMFARRYMHQFGATSEDFGRVSVVARKHAANNPNAWFYGKPITLEDHQNSPWIVDPLHLLDCCQESDGGVALVVTTAERARDLPQRPAYISAAAQGAAEDQHMMTSYYRPDEKVTALPEMGLVAKQLYETSGLTPDDINAAVIYDHFTPFVLPQLEAFGFCGRGEAKDFIRDGNLEIGGRLPLNTHGGQLGEAYIHGVNGVLEGVRQVRGTSSNQVDGLSNILVTAGTGVPTSGLILSRQ
ncbi:lipid-transfer protein [Microbispora sp. H11081]|uniref:lipid-transfer protein n=1 Tax=Microbispora sp. H11081 TaxID=2729107 RepID=UPI001474C59A|nr:lipid-transfer protein [Microbispora sp. H11081]